MASIAKKFYKITTISGNFKVKLPVSYDDVKTQLGLSDLSDSSADINLATQTASQLLRIGLATKIRIIRKTTINNVVRYKTHDLICSIANLASALSTLEGKKFGTNLAGGSTDIINAYFGRRARRG